MKIAITGGGGFLGQRLAASLLGDPRVRQVVLADVADFKPVLRDPRLVSVRADLTDPAAAASVAKDADVIVHLAAILSGQSEADFDLGMKVNLDGTRCLLEAARATGRKPVFVFASSLAVFGPPLPKVVTDETPVHPQSSYGMQKAVGELLVVDYSRKGFIDGRVARLPTVCIRPGLPNSATSSFVSGIIREPLNGKDAVCPVGTGFELWLSSPRVVVANLVRAAFLDSEALGNQRILNVPGITVAVSEMLTALRKVGGEEAVARIQFKDDPVARRVVSSWPARFDVSRALGLGFVADADFETMVREYASDRASQAAG